MMDDVERRRTRHEREEREHNQEGRIISWHPARKPATEISQAGRRGGVMTVIRHVGQILGVAQRIATHPEPWSCITKQAAAKESRNVQKFRFLEPVTKLSCKLHKQQLYGSS